MSRIDVYFETTEQNNAKANDFETKSLLYLMSFKSDSTDIDSFFVDCLMISLESAMIY